MERTHRHFVLGVVLASLAGATAQAENPPGNALGKPGTGSEGRPGMGTTDAKAAVKAEKAADKAADKAEKAADKAEKAADKAERSADKAEQRADKADQRADGSKVDGMRGKSGSSAGMAGTGFRSGMRMLREGVRDGSIKREELKERLEKLRANMAERRREHREAIRSRWGSTLASAPARDEVRQHGRRMAMLNRALLLAQTEAKPPNQEKLIERIEKLIERENTRHERAMNSIKTMPAAANTVAANNPASARGNDPSSMPGSNPGMGDKPSTGSNPSPANANSPAGNNPAMGTKGAEK